MATGQDLIDAARRHLGEPYSTDPGRDDPDSGHKDCSGLISAAYLTATGRPLGANVSVTIFALCSAEGLEISFDEAVGIVGAVLLIPTDPLRGWGPNGHIGFSDGAGGTVEATLPRVAALSATFQPWGPRACLLPGIDYGRTPAPEEIDMKSMLIHAPGSFATAVYDPANHTKTLLRSAAVLEGLKAIAPRTGLIVDGPDNGVFEVSQEFWDSAVTLVPSGETGEPCPDCPPGIQDASNDALIGELNRRMK
jgi:hypothetical protein